jgi:hypothetical protein
MRLLLDNPDFADQVIPDLARWEDWSVLDRLAAMYREGNEKSYVRQPIVTYLTVASEQQGEVGTRAQAALADLEQLDPEGVKRARSLMAFGFLARARNSDNGTAATRPADDTSTTATAGFSAGAAEAAEEDADPSGIPDPAEFGDSGGDTEPLTDHQTADEAPANERAAESVEPAVASQPATDEALPPATPKEYSRPLVIGLPIAAALALMVVYWLILRWGAV